MLLAVISDIHGNLEALEAVLADIGRMLPDSIVNLGDLVGYGPDPEAVVKTLRGRGIPSVMGNHELGLVEPDARAWFNPQARGALDVTATLLSDDSLDYLAGLPLFLVMGDVRLVHGFPPDSVTDYLFEASEGKVRRAMEALDQHVCFVGHTHEAMRYSLTDKLRRRKVVAGINRLNPRARHLINAGSVGQPRDFDPRAKYILFDEEAKTLDLRLLEYDHRLTARKIIKRGLPEIYARRLG